MEFQALFKVLQKHKIYVFSFEDALLFFPQERRQNLKRMILRWKKQGMLVSLKRGLYELTYPDDFHIPDLLIANCLYNPSYVSLETALSNYSIIPEVSMAVSSVTAMPTRRFKNKHGLFIYRSVTPSAYTGYIIQKQADFDIRIAEPEKALVDYLYFKTYRDKKIDFAQERLDKGVIGRLNKRRLAQYAGLFNLSLKELYAYL
jgi:predicted transcriptional regulator of viral defense system